MKSGSHDYTDTLKERSAENFMRGVFNDIYAIFF